MADSRTSWRSVDEKVRRNRGKRRSHLEVQAAILRALAADYMTMNQLAIHVNLNSAFAKRLVKELFDKGQIETRVIRGLASHSATQSGVAWLKHFDALVHD